MTTHPDSISIQRGKYVATDWLTSSVGFLLFNICRFQLLSLGNEGYGDVWEFLLSGKIIAEQIIVPTVMLGEFWLSGYYNRPYDKSRLQEFLTTLASAIINSALIYLILLINDQTGVRRLNYEVILTLTGLLFLCNYSGRLAITQSARLRFKRKEWTYATLIIGNSPDSRKMARRLENANTLAKSRILGFVPLPGETAATDDMRRIPLSDIEDLCRRENVGQIIIAPESVETEKVLELLYRLYPLDIPIKIAPDTFSLLTSSVRIRDINAEPFIDLTRPAMSEASKNVKRVFDVTVSSLALLLLSPLMGWIALAVKRGSKGPVVYSQERIGYHQRPFRIYKFRSMYEGSEKDGPRLSSDGDPRITPTGRILRKYRLDELPQFWNVIKGDMSIVGPRPERRYFMEQIMREAPYYAMVCQVRPGITSWGMVKYGYATTVEEMVERMHYDLIYLSNMSNFIDLKIILHTVRTIAGGKGK